MILGSPGLQLACPEPGTAQLLPIHDTLWLDGKISHSEALLTTRFHEVASVGPFAQTCQSIHVLGKVLRHIQRASDATDLEPRLQEALSLHTALTALHDALDAQQLSQDPESDQRAACPLNATALAICCSARLLLYNQYACNDPTQLSPGPRLAAESQMQAISLDGIRAVASATLPRLASALTTTTTDWTTHGPWLAYPLHHAATECAWFIREGGVGLEVMKEAFCIQVQALSAMSRCWKIAGNDGPFQSRRVCADGLLCSEIRSLAGGRGAARLAGL